MMRRPLRGPAVHPGGDVELFVRAGGEAEARVGVPDTKDLAWKRPAFSDEPLEAAVARLREAEDRHRSVANLRLDRHAVPALAVKEAQPAQDRSAFGDADVERPVVAHEDEVFREI